MHLLRKKVKGESDIIIEFESLKGRIYRNDLIYLEPCCGVTVQIDIAESFDIEAKYVPKAFSIKRIYNLMD